VTKSEIHQQALELPPEERQDLATALWESLEAEPTPLPEWQRRLLDERLAALEEKPEPGAPWDEVEKRIWPEGG
jgi:putative addiction module component (TIGR02574 family)